MTRGLLRRLDQRALRDAYTQAFAGAAGKLVLADLMAFGHVGSPVHVPGDPLTTAFNDGKRRMVLRIQKFLHMDDAELMRRALQEEDTDG
jgi:hypothetical protein